EGGPFPLELWLVGKMLRRTAPGDQRQPCNRGWFSRQSLALGESGQTILRNLHVGVVGLGGTGSVAFCQLPHLGIRRITVVDGDLVEPTNVSRILGATVRDAGRTWKVDVAARYAAQLGLETEVVSFRGHLGNDVTVEDLEGCD